MKIEPHNFRKPSRLASDLEEHLAGWLRRACTIAPEKCAKELPFRLDMSLQGLETVHTGDALARFPDATVSYRIALAAEGTNTLLVLPRPLILFLLAGLLGDAGTELPADRELTIVEGSLCEYLVQHLLLAALEETWPGLEPLGIRMGLPEPHPKYARVFAPDENPLLCAFLLCGPFGQQEWHWMLPAKFLLEQFTRTWQSPRAAQEALERSGLETVVRDLPVEVSVALGSAELPLSLLEKLRAGDVVILNQRVSDPLTVSVAGEKKFRVWPGRIGSRQAFQIESLLEC